MACSHLQVAGQVVDIAGDHLHYGLFKHLYVESEWQVFENPLGAGNHFATSPATESCMRSEVKLHVMTCICLVHI